MMNEKIVQNEFVKFVKELYPNEYPIPLHAPRFSAKEKELVLDTLDSTYVSTVGEYVGKFENRIALQTSAKYVVATNTGTAALHTALLVCGVTLHDEVITQSLTFVATCNAIRYCGASPVFVDISNKTLGMSPESLSDFLAEHAEVRDDGLCWNRTTGNIIRACVPMHNLGHPVEVLEIKEICDSYQLLVIEDAAESLGSTSQGLHTGLVGRVGILSFNGNKIITAGGGGALITSDENLWARAKHLTTTAKINHPWLFLHDEVGFNYRMPNINAALGYAQIEKLTQYIKCKRRTAARYSEWMGAHDVEFIAEPIGARSNYWLNAVILSNVEARDSFLNFTNDNGVMTRPMWTPMHTLPMFEKCVRASLDSTENIEARLVCLPSSVKTEWLIEEFV